MVSYNAIGQHMCRADGPEKVTGRGLYTADIHLPGILCGKALRSPLPNARISRIDVSRAREVTEVHAVLTGADVRGVHYRRRLYDVPASFALAFPLELVALSAESGLSLPWWLTWPQAHL